MNFIFSIAYVKKRFVRGPYLEFLTFSALLQIRRLPDHKRRSILRAKYQRVTCMDKMAVALVGGGVFCNASSCLVARALVRLRM